MTWTNITAPSSTNEFLLKEDGDFLLLETGDKIILVEGDGSFTNNTDIGAASWTNVSAP